MHAIQKGFDDVSVVTSGVIVMHISPGIVFPRSHIPRDACFPRTYIIDYSHSTSHNDMCFPGYFASPPFLF